MICKLVPQTEYIHIIKFKTCNDSMVKLLRIFIILLKVAQKNQEVFIKIINNFISFLFFCKMLLSEINLYFLESLKIC